jgi:hypothetical protein
VHPTIYTLHDYDHNEQGNTLTSISKLLSTTEYSGYPIVKSLESMQVYVAGCGVKGLPAGR